MDMKKLTTTLIVPLLFLAGCGAAAETGDQDARSKTRAAVAFLEDTERAAKSYGRDKLGHFLKLDTDRLIQQGLQVPSGTSLRIQTAHNGYCIEVENDDLSSGNRWQRATVASGFSSISAADSCRLVRG